MAYPSRTADQFQLRLPKGMRDALRKSAERHERSVNSEIVFHLRNALGLAAGAEFGDAAPAAGAEGKADDRSLEA